MINQNRQRTRSKTLSLVCTAGVLAGYTFFCIQGTSAANDPEIDGRVNFDGGDYFKALQSFNNSLKQRPRDWHTLQSIANCHLRLGQNEAAIRYLQRSIEIGGLHASQCTIMAAALEGLGQPNKALSWLRLACSVDPAQAQNPGMKAAIKRLEEEKSNPSGSPDAPDYFFQPRTLAKEELFGAVYFKGWPQRAMPLRIYVRRNVQIPNFYESFVDIVRDSLGQWCEASGKAISYKLLKNRDSADIIFDYTDRRELVSSHHELGIDGNCDMLVKEDGAPGPTNVTVLVKDNPQMPTFRNRNTVILCCLHETGHTLGMHGHSSNVRDVMSPVMPVVNEVPRLSQRDKNTIRKMYWRPSAR